MALSVDIRARLGDFRLDVRFDAPDGPLALLGASGCGKSVTLRCIAGILTPGEGRILLDGVTLFDSAARINLTPQRRRVGYLFQQYALFPHMTVRQNLAAAVPDRRRRRERVPELLRRFRLEDEADLRPRQLSGGQQQRTALARILASEPKAILLDEPFSALDGYLRSQLEAELLDALDAFPGPVLWVTHDRGEAYRNCRRVCVMDRGRSQPVRTMEELFRSPGTEAAARLCGCENFSGVEVRDGRAYLMEWGIALACAVPAAEGVRRAGIRARSVHIASPEERDAFPCRVVRAVEDVSSTVFLLRPLAAREDAPLLRMELDRGAAAPPEEFAAAVSPEGLLLLRE